MECSGNEWERMSLVAKTLDFARGCNSIQNQLVKFPYLTWFGTVRSEVRILSPRPDYFRKRRSSEWRLSFVTSFVR
jgi:hypothetical protein